MSCQAGVCMDSQAKKYVAALTNPFSKDAIGAQVPDVYSFPTETRFIKTDLKLFSDSDGNLDFSLLPNLFQSILTGTPEDLSHFANNNLHMNTIGSSAEFQYTGADSVDGSADGKWNLGGVTVPSQLAAQLSQYRIVGWGARVRALVAPLVQSGRLIFSSTPSASNCLFEPNLGPNYGAVNYGDVCRYFKLPLPDNGYLTAEMLNVPDAMECMFSDLSLSGGMQWVSKSTSPESLSFNSTNNNAVIGDNSLGFGLIDLPDSYALRAFTVAQSLSTNYVSPAISSNILSGSIIQNVGTSTDTFQLGVTTFSSGVVTTGNTGVLNGMVISRVGVPVIPATNIFVAGSAFSGDYPLVGYGWRKAAYVAGGVVDLILLASGAGAIGGTVTTVALSNAAGGIITTLVGFTNPNVISFAANDTIVFFPCGNIQSNPTVFIPLKAQYIQGSNANISNLLVNSAGYEKGDSKYLLTGNSPANGYTVSSLPSSVDPSYIKSGGWSQMSCRGFGLPKESACLSVEIVYHIEGPPLISGQTGGLVAGGMFPYVDKGLFDEALEYAARKPHFQLIPGGRSGSTLTNLALN